MNHQLFRLDPAMPVSAYKTYQVTAPLSTHFRRATCAEVDCPHYVHGWQTTIDERTELGQEQAHYIRNGARRQYTEDRNQAPGLTVFTFEAGQTCFAGDQHHVPLDRPALYVVRDGDWRGNPTGNIARRRPDEWVDDFAAHQDKLATELEKG